MRPAVALVLLSLGCSSRKGASVVSPTFDRLVEGVRVVETVDGRVLWALKAGEAVTKDDTTSMSDVEVKFFRADGGLSSVLTSSSGLYMQRSGDMLATGSVRVEGVENNLLLTPSLRFVRREQLITTDDTVYIEKGDRVIRGHGLDSDPQLTHVVIRADVTSEGEDEDLDR